MDVKSRIERVKLLVIKKLTEQLTEEETKELESLMQTDARCHRLAERILSSPFLLKAVSDRNRKQLDNSWRTIYNRIGYKGGIFRSRRAWRMLVAAAVVLLFVFGGYVWWNKEERHSIISPGGTYAEICWPDGRQNVYTSDMLTRSFSLSAVDEKQDTLSIPSLSPDLYTRIVVPRGSEYRIKLDDGTLVHLNAESTLAIPTDFSVHNRRMNLSGEAYLEVSKDSLHPFYIETGKAHVTVLGTSLNVRCYEDEPCMEVILESGKVDIRTIAQCVSLPVKHKAVVDEEGDVRVFPADIYMETAWHQGRFVFEDCPLEIIMRDLERWYKVEASFSSDEARRMCFTFDLDRYDTFNHFMEVMQMTDEVSIHLEHHDRVLISKKEH